MAIVDLASLNLLCRWHPSRTDALTIAASVAILVGLGYHRYSAEPSEDGIPSPSGSIPFFGHLWKLRKGTINQCMQWQHELGPIYRLNLGMQRWIVIGSPIIAHEIMVAQGSKTALRPHIQAIQELLGWGGSGIAFANPSKPWREMRAALSALVHPNNLTKYSTRLDQDADELVDYLLSHNGNNLDPEMALSRSALNFILVTCFATSVPSVDDPILHQICSFMDDAFSFVGRGKEERTFLPAIGSKTKDRFRQFLHEKHFPLVKQLIQTARDSGEECLIKKYYELKGENVIDDDDIIQASTEILTAGADTNVATMLWQLLILTKYPHVQAKMKSEIDHFVAEHGRLPTFAERRSIPYTIAVQKECIRFRPTSFSGLPHQTDADINWRGNIIEKGTIIIANMRCLHTSTELFEDPQEFRPERFLLHTNTMFREAYGKAVDRTHFVFGFGRRTCPGIHLAELQMFNVFVRLFHRCTIMPGVDDNGQPIPVDLDKRAQRSLVAPPASYVVRFVARN